MVPKNMFSQGFIPDPSFPVRIIVDINLLIRIEFLFFISFLPFTFTIILIPFWIIIEILVEEIRL